MMNEFHPKVSIIIPVYNGARYLAEAIESALAQSYNNVEILVINDGSNDNGETERVALSYGNKIRYYSKPNGGVASALNTGISLMQGEYFSWLSHDDLYENDKLQRQIDALKELNAKKVVLYSDFSVFTTSTDKNILCKMKGVEPHEFRYWLTVENSLHGCTLLIPKSAFAECGLFNEQLKTTQDYDKWFRMASSYQFLHMNMPLVKARSHSEQGSISMADIALKECNDLLSHFTNALSEKEITTATGHSLCLSYAKIAASMWYRGFFQAGSVAMRLSFKNIFKAPPNEVIQALLPMIKGYCMYYIVKPSRKLLSPYMRQFLKRLFKGNISAKSQPQKASPVDKLRNMKLDEKFSLVYQENIFNGRKSRSGEGSDLTQTQIIREEIPKLVKEYNISTFLDAPCGDWFWMSHTNLNVDKYIGVDIVNELINKHKQEYADDKTIFEHKNLVVDSLPKADLIFSRDCLVHLSFEDALNIIKNFKATGAKYLLTTTFTERDRNEDLGDGFWRTLNMQLAPFNFPTPIRIINEGCTEGNNMFTDKCLGLWKLEDIFKEDR